MGKKLTGGPRMSARGERKGKPAKGATRWRYTKGTRVGWAEWEAVTYGEGRGGWSWAGRDEFLGKIQMEKMIFEFHWNLKFGKTLGNCTRRFKRNLDMRVFPKFFYTSQGFLENKICHAMICNLRVI
jgi:hypothetical protein